MSLVTAATYRNEFKNKMLQQHTRINKHLQSSHVHAKVTSLLQYTHTLDDGLRLGRKYQGTN